MPYELNINYLDALGDPDQPRLDVALVARRFLSAQAIMLSLRGVPGIYFHSLFGSRNWPQGVQETGHYRTINREKLTRSTLEQELSDPQSLRSHVFRGYSQLLRARTGHPAFHPSGSQQVLPVHDAIFALHRTSPDAQHHLLCLHNVSPNHHSLSLALPADFPAATHLRDLLTGETYPVRQRQLEVTVPAYGVLWVTVDGRRRTADRTQLARNIHRHNSISSMVAPATREGE